jgi:DEAD/DEAH box helicase domain-containing protein
VTDPGNVAGEGIEAALQAWRADPEAVEAIVHERLEPGISGTYARLQPALPERIVARLADHGIERLYRHQVTAIEDVRAGRDIVVAAGTASGKSLAYQLPIAESIDGDPATCALLLYPTKALSRDQLRGVGRLGSDELVGAVYDGDTDVEARRWIRRHANVVLTNPDMLHVGILPNHGAWARFLTNLRYVVVDELHVLRGVFGSHTAHVLRRLRRIAAGHGAHPTFVFTSATIGNPGELASGLIGRPVLVVDQDASPRGPRRHVIWNPEVEDPETGRRASSLGSATKVFSDLVSHDVSTILFARSRKAAELTYRWSRDRLDADRRARISSYRAGYLPEERRRIEQRLFAGELLGVTATNALELGIDVGGLDATIASTFPGTIASYRQQSGRAGRGSDLALSVLVAGQDALDQYYAAHPDRLYAGVPEAAVINPGNPAIADAHVQCAAAELPLKPDDRDYFGDEFEETVNRLVQAGTLGIRDGRVFWPGGRSPAATIDLRAAGGRRYVIVDDRGNLLGSVDEDRAFSQCHRGAVYLHRGDGYLVERCDIELAEVRVRREEVPYYTQPKSEKDLAIIDLGESKSLGHLTVRRGLVAVESQVVAFQRKEINTGAIIDTEPLDLPVRRLQTEAVWYEFPGTVLADADVDAAAAPGTLHAVEHAAIGVLPLFAICDRWDVGGLSAAAHPDTPGGVFFIYDGYDGGIGIATMAFAAAQEHLEATLDLVAACPCRGGCPSCVQSPKCGNFNEPLDKAGAIRLLGRALR